VHRCRYCIQACPYGARYLSPVTHTADKCTFCYHRISVDSSRHASRCARPSADLRRPERGGEPAVRFLRMNKIHVLKPGLNTEPKVYYANLDGEVR